MSNFSYSWKSACVDYVGRICQGALIMQFCTFGEWAKEAFSGLKFSFSLTRTDNMPTLAPPSSTLRSGVVDYVIFLSTLYGIIFQWLSYTLDSDPNVFVEHDCFLNCWIGTLDLNVMEWPCSCPLCWLCHLACPKGLARRLIQHNGHHTFFYWQFINSKIQKNKNKMKSMLMVSIAKNDPKKEL